MGHTTMKKFGTGDRISHDSSKFYKRKFFEDKFIKNIESKSNNVKNLNKIYQHSSESMTELPDNSIHLMITSPPYNVGKEYDDDLTLQEYMAMLNSVWKETYRVLVPGGRACVNIANLGRKPYIPLSSMITMDMIKMGYLMRGEIIWDKGQSAGSSCAWGSWQSPSNPVLRDTHEYIMVFSKNRYNRSGNKDASIHKTEFLSWTKSVWRISAESAKKVGHPAPFPVELPNRLINLYTYVDDIVLDPFMGSGTTAVASINSGRKYVGYETSAQYTKLAEKRIKETQPILV